MKPDIRFNIFLGVMVGIAVVAGVYSAALIHANETGVERVDADILTHDNLVREINDARVAAGANELVVDKSLSALARAISEDAATQNGSQKDASDGVTFLLRILTGDYYSTDDFVAMLAKDHRTLLFKRGEKIGVWITYSVRNEGDKPDALVTVIIR